mmetsp:Transcript_14745/g.44542  ORF Transcript_14745/g.44542 Transcript_14745/m.44542 type:complete len:234 (-) Transcript_14745:787-1488(-)
MIPGHHTHDAGLPVQSHVAAADHSQQRTYGHKVLGPPKSHIHKCHGECTIIAADLSVRDHQHQHSSCGDVQHCGYQQAAHDAHRKIPFRVLAFLSTSGHRVKPSKREVHVGSAAEYAAGPMGRKRLQVGRPGLGEAGHNDEEKCRYVNHRYHNVEHAALLCPVNNQKGQYHNGARSHEINRPAPDFHRRTMQLTVKKLGPVLRRRPCYRRGRDAVAKQQVGHLDPTDELAICE